MNGTAYDVTDMQAPMDTWGICHWHSHVNPFSITTIGKDTSTNYLAVDIGELVIADGGLSISAAREVCEYMQAKWGVTT